MTSNDFNNVQDDAGHIAEEFHGRMIAGPFRVGNLQDIEKSMRKFGILCHEDGRRGSWSSLLDGYEVRAEGPGVRGYFVDFEGMESPRSDLDAMVLETVPPETDFYLRGIHQVDEDRMVAVSMRARHDGDSVVWTGRRALISADEQPQVTSDTLPIPGF